MKNKFRWVNPGIRCAECGRPMSSVNRPHDYNAHTILEVFKDAEDIPPPRKKGDPFVFETRGFEFYSETEEEAEEVWNNFIALMERFTRGSIG